MLTTEETNVPCVTCGSVDESEADPDCPECKGTGRGLAVDHGCGNAECGKCYPKRSLPRKEDNS